MRWKHNYRVSKYSALVTENHRWCSNSLTLPGTGADSPLSHSHPCCHPALPSPNLIALQLLVRKKKLWSLEVNCISLKHPSLELTERMVSVLLSIASFSSDNTVRFFGNVRGKLPALLSGLDGYWSIISTLLFPLQWGTNHLILTDNNDKPSLGLQEMLYCI